MLKIYLDWNIITHIDKSYPNLLHLMQEYNHLFVFPYTAAHIRDVVHKSDLNNALLQHDVELLSSICDKHLLIFEDNTMKPYFATPKDYIGEKGISLSIIQNTEFISRSMYITMKQMFQKYIANKDRKALQDIQGSSCENVMKNINGFIKAHMNADDVVQFINNNCPKETLNNKEAFFKTLYFMLDLFGFRQEEKKKEFNNIDTDATHIYYASYCDYMVTKDGRMSEKCKALYKEYNIQTEVITPQTLERIIQDEIKREYSLKYLIDCINRYGIPRKEEDGNHYTLMRTPILGLFNACMIVDKSFGNNTNVESALFRYCFNNTPYLFYTELERFFELFRNIIPKEKAKDFEELYVKPMLSRNYEITKQARFNLDVNDLELHIHLLSDPIAEVPCPMMQIILGGRCRELIQAIEQN